MSYKPSDVVTSEEDVRAILPDQYEAQTGKIITFIDDLCRTWIERSPFIVMSTVGQNGKVDTSPKGDPAGFVKVIDPQTLAIPDRPGNNRFDSFRNIIDTGRIGLVFLVPNRNEVVRVSGSACVVRDAELRQQMAINGRVPEFAIVVKVEEAFFHCGKAALRSKLWSPEKAEATDGLATYGEALKLHAALDMDIDELDRRLIIDEKATVS
ncbi:MULTISPECIES: MSMEG_1061 family FMN-dependent PPOX-type flavoprotein [Roseobacteraceae]|uniref:MSMEG_1061 family FMN-dependent PPOX-type flavoprotein n=1 Tax=Roseobacteraceae TaxID=2854170 RepID=UPI003297DCD5